MKSIFLSFVLIAGAFAVQAAPMTFLASHPLNDGGGVVQAEGDIDSSTVAAFNAYRKAHPGLRRIMFNSEGGSVVEALALGRAIREAGLNTYVGGTYKGGEGTAASLRSVGECYSACVWAFAGGVFRYFDADGGVMGVHQFEFAEDKSAHTAKEGTMSAQFLMTAIGMYLDEMGVSRNLLDWATMTPSSTIQPLPRAIAVKFLLDNIGDKLPATSEPPKLTSVAHPPSDSALERSFPLSDWLNAGMGEDGHAILCATRQSGARRRFLRAHREDRQWQVHPCGALDILSGRRPHARRLGVRI